MLCYVMLWRTDRILIARPHLHCMQRGKKQVFLYLLDSTRYKHRLLENMLSLIVKLNGQMNSTSKAALLKVVTTVNGIWIPTKLPPCTWKLQILCCDWWTCHDPETWEASQLPDIRRLCRGVHEQRVRHVSRLSHKGRHRFIGKHSMKASTRKKRVGRELDQFVYTLVDEGDVPLPHGAVHSTGREQGRPSNFLKQLSDFPWLSDNKDIVTGGGFCNSLGAKSSVHGDWLTDWLTECLYYDIWQTADEITVDMYINVIVCTAKSTVCNTQCILLS